MIFGIIMPFENGYSLIRKVRALEDSDTSVLAIAINAVIS
jgi:hypothetical protein